ncbi:MAG: putative rRNA maturation factor, partial [Gaiellaceae bacterium]|nr:putative rRNA maturation factor [Gaiellaceae bacterium]
MVSVDVDNRSGVEVDEAAATALARRVLSSEGVEEGELGLAFVGPEEMRTLKREHLGIDEATDVLSFPIDGREVVPHGVPRALGDVVLCPEVVGDAWRRPL